MAKTNATINKESFIAVADANDVRDNYRAECEQGDYDYDTTDERGRNVRYQARKNVMQVSYHPT